MHFPLDHISPCEQDLAGYVEDGILYQGDGIIRHLWLSFNGLMGSGIPPELYLLTELRSLALDGLNLTSTIPDELIGLPGLEYISMISCGLFGSIPEAIGHAIVKTWNHALWLQLPDRNYSIIPVYAYKPNASHPFGRKSADGTSTNRTGIANKFVGSSIRHQPFHWDDSHRTWAINWVEVLVPESSDSEWCHPK
ncbi:expressed unknown protein [Seminavis robusta]|uniref:Uncharacterized protein n=1 Tax=Seminavis robusta TaxID=568900 RepID=A0A9N8EUG2_9STRA|nr:expressed unknown protein [Seminavis robusta]|eukprot:Sro1852_g301720.1 n/a (195) ;mRNA; f:7396-8211